MDSFEQINESAMKIILHAGNARLKMNEAFNLLETSKSDDINGIMSKAHEEVIKAHKVQTEIIQTYIEDADFKSSLLFTHAQDTLMTVYSEFNMMKKLIKLYELIISKSG